MFISNESAGRMIHTYVSCYFYIVDNNLIGISFEVLDIILFHMKITKSTKNVFIFVLFFRITPLEIKCNPCLVFKLVIFMGNLSRTHPFLIFSSLIYVVFLSFPPVKEFIDQLRNSRPLSGNIGRIKQFIHHFSITKTATYYST